MVEIIVLPHIRPAFVMYMSMVKRPQKSVESLCQMRVSSGDGEEKYET